ncbi:MAG: hypothetical protein AUJ92_03870 [Armatimonadetes bacterium CG2_30_59_28]|nr:molecular chaperone TorD family protein [Armatimonadota bacterium]OIO97335.1 MAG: hypothetical protein AUJ92_03870 [Armatimonadetes bacterium CG2_30_59_28]
MDAESRAEVFEFFASVFSREPTPELADSLLSGNLQRAIRFVEREVPSPAILGTFAALAAWIAYLRSKNSDAERVCEMLRNQYSRLLSIPGADYVAPYESVYLDKAWVESTGIPDTPFVAQTVEVKGLLWGESTSAVLHSYREAGIQPHTANCCDPPDHLGLELEFMAYLCRQESLAIEKGADAQVWVERQRRFLCEHLTRWLPEFASRLGDKSPQSFYAAATTAIVEFTSNQNNCLPAGAR